MTKTPAYYSASIIGHDIARAREVKADTLVGIKRKATAEFGDGFQHHTIVVWGMDGTEVSRRRIGERRWQDFQ